MGAVLPNRWLLEEEPPRTALGQGRRDKGDDADYTRRLVAQQIRKSDITWPAFAADMSAEVAGLVLAMVDTMAERFDQLEMKLNDSRHTQAVRLAEIERLRSFDLRLARIEARLGEPMSQADRIIMAVMEKRQRDTGGGVAISSAASEGVLFRSEVEPQHDVYSWPRQNRRTQERRAQSAHARRRGQAQRARSSCDGDDEHRSNDHAGSQIARGHCACSISALQTDIGESRQADRS